MDDNLTRMPGDVALGDLSREVFTVLARFTAFPWPVLKAQAARQGADPAQLSVDELRGLVELLARGVSRFTSPQTGEEVKRELEALVRTWPKSR
jgi:hypothetical protein